jgi:hypothetical protein
LAGREFDARDKVGAPSVAIVNEAFAQKFLNEASPVGQRLWVEGMFGAPETSYEIVGLARDTKQGNLREEFRPLAYTAAAQDPHTPPGGPVLIRSRLPQTEIVAAVKRVLHEINPAKLELPGKAQNSIGLRLDRRASFLPPTYGYSNGSRVFSLLCPKENRRSRKNRKSSRVRST